MHPFFQCFGYVLNTGLVSFLIGRLLPKRWPRATGFFRCFAFEKEGRFYDKFGVRYWQKRAPDMSKLLPFLMPKKNLCANCKNQLPRMIRETCVAELIHWALCISGLYCLRLWSGIGGILVVIANTIGNLAFVIIQRYNRPRLIRLMNKLNKQKEESVCAC